MFCLPADAVNDSTECRCFITIANATLKQLIAHLFFNIYTPPYTCVLPLPAHADILLVSCFVFLLWLVTGFGQQNCSLGFNVSVWGPTHSSCLHVFMS